MFQTTLDLVTTLSSIPLIQRQPGLEKEAVVKVINTTRIFPTPESMNELTTTFGLPRPLVEDLVETFFIRFQTRMNYEFSINGGLGVAKVICLKAERTPGGVQVGILQGTGQCEAIPQYTTTHYSKTGPSLIQKAFNIKKDYTRQEQRSFNASEIQHIGNYLKGAIAREMIQYLPTINQ